MRKMMVYLDEDQFLRLKKRAAETGQPVAALVREAVNRYLAGAGGQVDYFSFVGSAAGPEGGNASETCEEILRHLLRETGPR